MARLDKYIVVIDANRFICEVLNSIFARRLKLPTMVTTDIREAGAALPAMKTAFVLLGADWPTVAETRQAVEYLKAFQREDNTFLVILMIPDTEENAAAYAEQAGANGYIIKPFTEQEIINWIHLNSVLLLGTKLDELSPVAERSPMQMSSEGPIERTPEIERLIESYILDLKSGDFSLVTRACRELARLRAEEAVEPLSELLYDDNEDIRLCAIAALGNIGSPEAVEPLIALLNYKDPQIQEAVVEALGKIGDPRAVRPLSRILKVPERQLVLLAIKAMALLGTRAAVPYLEELLESRDEEIKANAQWAIRKIDGMDV